jgi:hypothetical protein
VLLYRHHNAEQNHEIKTANRSSENVAQFRSLGATESNRNLIQKEIKRRLNSDNALLPFGPESFAFWLSVQKRTN